jgi:hypothetical protein
MIPLAAIDPGLIIYLFIVFIWVLARLAGQGKRRKQQPPAGAPGVPPRRRPPVISDDLREMLETLTGQKLEIPEAPAPPPPPATPPRATPMRGLAAARRQEQERQRRERRVALAPTPPPPLVYATEPALPASEPPAVTHAGARKGSAMAMVAVPVQSTSFRIAHMGSSRVGLPPGWLADLKQAKTLRNAVVYETILGPPKAYGEKPGYATSPLK